MTVGIAETETEATMIAASEKARVTRASIANPAAPSLAVKVEGLTKSYGSIPVVRNISFNVASGSTVTLLGPSGCGKTTTLRCIAGLELPSRGRMTIGNEIVYDSAKRIFVKPECRSIGMVFQSYAIWPHMTVAGNVGFPLAVSGKSRREIRDQTAEILKLVGLQDFIDQPASQLSGGQQQRVALARALVHEPNIVLLDEPLSNLDSNLRERMRTELQLLQSRLRFTAIYVTHDQEEALSLSDEVIVINQGRIEQSGTPQDVFQNPRSEFTARFLGCSNILSGTVLLCTDERRVDVLIDGSNPLTATWRGDVLPKPGEKMSLGFRGDQARVLVVDTPGNQNLIRGEVETATFLGTRFDYTIKIGDVRIKAVSGVNEPRQPGQVVAIEIAVNLCHAFPAASASPADRT